MNICIVTVYNTENCGSFLQAWALKTVLEKMNNNVYFLYRDLSNTLDSFSFRLKICARKIAKLDFTAAYFIFKKREAFKYAQSKLNVIDESSPIFNDIDTFVIGSDTVWNFKDSYFYKNLDKYTGGYFGKGKSITYAASAANTSYETFVKDSAIKEGIEGLKAISVRDEDTKAIVMKLTGREATVVCDPTMLIETPMFDEFLIDIPDKKYILIYAFKTFSKEEREEILKFKEKHGLKLISFGESRPWCDKSMPYDVNAFVSYMKNADFVITNTFHGTIFSIINNKVFAEYGIKQKKISDLLNQLQLTNSVVNEERRLEDVFRNGLDYSLVNEKIKELRENSLRYLKENLSEN